MNRVNTIMRVTPDNRVSVCDEELFTQSMGDLLCEIGRLRALDRPSMVITVNVDQLLNLSRDRQFYDAYRHASIRTIDGAPIVGLAHLLGASDVHRNTGADLLPRVATAADRVEGWRVAIAGGSPAVLNRAVRRMREDHPNLTICGFEIPLLSSIDDPVSIEVIERLRVFEPDVVFLCLGSPKQELWFRCWNNRLPPAVYVGAGAAVDFAAGKRRRAPRFVQVLGMEWLWRFFQEPRRLGSRYFLKGPSYLAICWKSLMGGDRSA